MPNTPFANHQSNATGPVARRSPIRELDRMGVVTTGPNATGTLPGTHARVFHQFEPTPARCYILRQILAIFPEKNSSSRTTGNREFETVLTSQTSRSAQ